MNKNTIIEFASFQLVQGTDEGSFLRASESLQTGFLNDRPGFLRRDLIKGENGEWADLIYWKDRKSAEEAMRVAEENPACEEYFRYMVGPDHGDLTKGIKHFTQIRSYGNEDQ